MDKNPCGFMGCVIPDATRMQRMSRERYEGYPESHRGVSEEGIPYLVVDRTVEMMTPFAPITREVIRPVELIRGRPIFRLRFAVLHALAWARGLFWEWPIRPVLTVPRWPEGVTTVSCGLKTREECRQMYRLGWVPHCYQSTPYGIARLFVVYPDDEPEPELGDAFEVVRHVGMPSGHVNSIHAKGE